MRIHRLKTNHLTDPLGHALAPAVLSWVVEGAPGEAPAAARVEVAADEGFTALLHDSGFRTDIDSLAYRLPLDLLPKTRYFWRVSVRAGGAEDIGPPAWFETGLMGSFCQAQWIGVPGGSTAHPLFRRAFWLDGSVKSARAYVCGLGLYELEVNGQKAGDEYLAPFCNDYNHWLQLQTYDIAPLLRAGENVIGAALGNGWYKGRFGYVPGLDRLYGDSFLLWCHVEGVLEDGTAFGLDTDESWLFAPSPILESSIYDGEVYDARLEFPGWSAPGGEEGPFVPAAVCPPPAALLRDRYSLPLRIIERRRPVQLLHTPDGGLVLDFGQVMTGWVEFACSAPAGVAVTLQYGEILQDGNFYNENLRTAKQAYRYISDNTRRQVRPRFTFFGFRYVKIEGFVSPSLDDFTACVLCSVLEQTGRLSTANPKVNRLIENAFWSQKSNFVDIPTDCPQRDERMGWTGDAQVFCPTACFFTHSAAFYHKYITDMHAEQTERGGEVPHVVPDVLGQIKRRITPQNDPFAGTGGSCAWGDAAAIIPWQLYLAYGDKTLLAQHYPQMKAWVEYIFRMDETQCGGQRLWLCGSHFADWLSLDNYNKDSAQGGSDPYFVASAYYHRSALLTAKAAGVLGLSEDAARYHRLAQEILQAIRREYLTHTGRLAVDTQTGLALALSFGLVPGQHKARVQQDLAQRLERDNLHLTTGFVGTPCLCPALAESGYASHAYTLLLNEDYPSWLYAVNLGATTIWERWNSVLEDGRISGTGMNSLNHYAYGSIVDWLVRYACGLSPTEAGPGYRHACIRPYPDVRMGMMELEYQSAAGPYRVAWKMQAGKIDMRISVPTGATAEYHVTHEYGAVEHLAQTPRQEGKNLFHLEPGNYHFAFVQ